MFNKYHHSTGWHRSKPLLAHSPTDWLTHSHHSRASCGAKHVRLGVKHPFTSSSIKLCSTFIVGVCRSNKSSNIPEIYGRFGAIFSKWGHTKTVDKKVLLSHIYNTGWARMKKTCLEYDMGRFWLENRGAKMTRGLERGGDLFLENINFAAPFCSFSNRKSVK